MSQENVELARRAYEAFERRDLDAMLALADPEVEFVTRAEFVEGGSYHGHDGVRKWSADLLSVFPDWRVEIRETRDLGDLVLIAFHARAHGERSGTPIDQDFWMAVRWRDGKAIWWGTYTSEAEALEAAGLRE